MASTKERMLEAVGQMRLPTLDNWDYRELGRFFSNAYTPLPWIEGEGCDWYEPITRHYAHVSRQNPAMLAFTGTPGHGAADRQTRLRPGRYLSRFFPHLSPQQVSEAVGLWKSDLFVLRVAMTPEEITWVYENGPNSCMSYTVDATWSHLGAHPCSIYGAGDLGVAFIMEKGMDADAYEDISDRMVAARTLCWPEKNIHSSVYGDYETLRPLLRDHGWQVGQIDDWRGAKLNKVMLGRDPDNYLVPYIDNGNSLGVGQKYLHTGCTRRSQIPEWDLPEVFHTLSSGYTAGCSVAAWCEACESHAHDVAYVDGRTYCEYCLHEYTSTCERCNNRRHDTNIYYLGDSAYCEHCRNDMGTLCDRCHQWVLSDSIQPHAPSDTLEVCEPCFDTLTEQDEEEEE